MYTSTEILTLVCAEWNGPACALDSMSRRIRYANTPLQNLILKYRLFYINEGVLELSSTYFTSIFYKNIEEIHQYCDDTKKFALQNCKNNIHYDISIYNPQGSFRDTLCKLISSDLNPDNLIFARFNIMDASYQ